MRAADTNVITRLIVRDDERQVEAAKAFVAKGAWVSHLALVETAWVLDTTYSLPSSKVIEGIEMLLQNETLSLQEPEVVAAALEQFRKRPSLGFSDCMLLEVARKAGHLPLGTFDRGLSKLDGVERL